jgi:peptidoglycan DL-endopeptidase CwlO
VPDEQSPDSLAELLANRADTGSVPAPLVPAQPQYSSRREMKNAVASSRRPASRRPSGRGVSARITSAHITSAHITSGTSTSVARQKPGSSARLSRRDQLAIRKLAETPKIAPATSASLKRKRQNPLKVVFVLLVISGFVGGIALPAVASSGSTLQAGSTSTYKKSQSVKVSASIETATVSRDAVSATSEAELRTEQINAQTLADASRVRQPGDDYPWRDAGYSLSPLGYNYRQCVDFVAWRLNRDQGVTSAPWKWTWSNLTPNGGNASQWESAWIAHGWTTSATPIVGSVAWFVGNHVAYVHLISGSNVVIEEYNGTSSRAYAMRTIPITSVGRFLYPPT